MKPARAISLALFLGSMTLLAQGSGRNDTQSAVAKVAVPSLSCPITMKAQWQQNHGAPTFVNGQHNQTARKMHLIIKNPKLTEVVGLKITAHGLNSKPKISPAQAASSDSSEITKTFDLKLKIEPDSEASTDLSLPGFTSVASIELNAIHYAGGSKWSASASHSCNVIPDGMMLISSR